MLEPLQLLLDPLDHVVYKDPGIRRAPSNQLAVVTPEEPLVPTEPCVIHNRLTGPGVHIAHILLGHNHITGLQVEDHEMVLAKISALMRQLGTGHNGPEPLDITVAAWSRHGLTGLTFSWLTLEHGFVGKGRARPGYFSGTRTLCDPTGPMGQGDPLVGPGPPRLQSRLVASQRPSSHKGHKNLSLFRLRKSRQVW